MAAIPHRHPEPPLRSAGLIRALGRKLAELVTVFAGVYAAFLLNSYQVHRQDRQRREQILAWIEHTYTEWYNGIDREAERTKKMGADFDRQVDEGKMPALEAFNWYSDYNPADVTGLLQSGGFDLLDVDTIRSLKEVDGTLRRMVGIIQHDQQLSDALLLPNMDQDRQWFYDPATKHLRAPYRWYQTFFKGQSERYAELHDNLKTLLEKVRAERARNR